MKISSVGQTDGEIRAQAVGVVEALQVQGVELVHPILQRRQVMPPALHGPAVAVDPDGGKDGVPELGHRRVRLQTRKGLLGPGGDGHAGHAPGEAVGHLQAVELLQGGVGAPLAADNAVRGHAL